MSDCKNAVLINVNDRTDFPIKVGQDERLNISVKCEFPSLAEKDPKKWKNKCTPINYFSGILLFDVTTNGKSSEMEINVHDFVPMFDES